MLEDFPGYNHAFYADQLEIDPEKDNKPIEFGKYSVEDIQKLAMQKGGGEQQQISQQGEDIIELHHLVLMIGYDRESNPTDYEVCIHSQIWRKTPILWSRQGTERIEVYQLMYRAQPIRTIVMGEEEDQTLLGRECNL